MRCRHRVLQQEWVQASLPPLPPSPVRHIRRLDRDQQSQLACHHRHSSLLSRRLVISRDLEV